MNKDFLIVYIIILVYRGIFHLQKTLLEEGKLKKFKYRIFYNLHYRNRFFFNYPNWYSIFFFFFISIIISIINAYGILLSRFPYNEFFRFLYNDEAWEIIDNNLSAIKTGDSTIMRRNNQRNQRNRKLYQKNS
jgi:hypothetical protein